MKIPSEAELIEMEHAVDRARDEAIRRGRVDGWLAQRLCTYISDLVALARAGVSK